MNQGRETLSVSRLVYLLRDLVEENFVQVLVAGEVANFSTPSSGHSYFVLKDQTAQLRGVMFRSRNRLLRFCPENGMEVVCRGRISLYPQRGELQLIVDHMEPLGVGAWQMALEQLKNRLAAEGLFDEGRKRPLPDFPRTIGVVTSASGAAIHDILNVLRRRGAGLRVLLRSVRVQGEGAAAEIAAAIDDLNQHGEADVLIVGRGGGSVEDLWAFNEEPVARAVFCSAIPVISAVGHEVDVTLSDLVADLRAPTPSAAAEMVVKGREELERHVDHLVMRLSGQMKNRLTLLGERVTGLGRRLRSRSPLEVWRRHRLQLTDLQRRLSMALEDRLSSARNRLAGVAGKLHALSPLATLERGYAIVFRADRKTAVRDARQLKAGEHLEVRFARGRILARVEKNEF
jgi:exodeoxyribonuclease VII large subunit